MTDLSARSDCAPGREFEISFTPDKVRRLSYVSDNFRGEGHDEMNGRPIITSV